MRWLIYREQKGTREPFRIVEASSSEEALHRVQTSTPVTPWDKYSAVDEKEADPKDWAQAERSGLRTTMPNIKRIR
jgi:hypothetical protein